MYNSVEEFSVQTIEIGGLGAALKALRLPFGKECRSDVNFHFSPRYDVFTDGVERYVHDNKEFGYGTFVLVDDNDINLLSTLVKRGDEHAKVLRGVVVLCEINAPLYFWKEMDTYRVGAERLSSESSMHIEGKGLPEEELIEMQESMPCSPMQKRIWMFSYQTLRRIYQQRKNHRLPQWRKFCEWIEKLPFAEDFITIGL